MVLPTEVSAWASCAIPHSYPSGSCGPAQEQERIRRHEILYTCGLQLPADTHQHALGWWCVWGCRAGHDEQPDVRGGAAMPGGGGCAVSRHEARRTKQHFPFPKKTRCAPAPGPKRLEPPPPRALVRWGPGAGKKKGVLCCLYVLCPLFPSTPTPTSTKRRAVTWGLHLRAVEPHGLTRAAGESI